VRNTTSAGTGFLQARSGFCAIHDRHRDIMHNDIWVQARGRFKSSLSVFDSFHHIKIHGEQPCNPLQDCMVIIS
jgi:hypothetical protein